MSITDQIYVYPSLSFTPEALYSSSIDGDNNYFEYCTDKVSDFISEPALGFGKEQKFAMISTVTEPFFELSSNIVPTKCQSNVGVRVLAETNTATCILGSKDIDRDAHQSIESSIARQNEVTLDIGTDQIVGDELQMESFQHGSCTFEEKEKLEHLICTFVLSYMITVCERILQCLISKILSSNCSL